MDVDWELRPIVLVCHMQISIGLRTNRLGLVMCWIKICWTYHDCKSLGLLNHLPSAGWPPCTFSCPLSFLRSTYLYKDPLPAGLRFQRKSLVKDTDMDESTQSDPETLKVGHV